MSKTPSTIARIGLILKACQAVLGIHVVMISAILGCKLTPQQSAVVAPKSTVIAQTAGTTPSNWLESATISYSRGGLAPTAQVVALTTNPPTDDEPLRVLGIRYPHPAGHRDRARVELVLARPDATRAAIPWYGQLGQALSETLPGISLGPGIQQAKSLDMPLTELQQLLTDLQGQVTLVSTAPSSTACAQYAAKVNGQETVYCTPPLAALEQLVTRVEREGRLMGYPESAEDLRARTAHANTPATIRQ